MSGAKVARVSTGKNPSTIFISKPTCNTANTKVNSSEVIAFPSAELLKAYRARNIKSIKNKTINATSSCIYTLATCKRVPTPALRNGASSTSSLAIYTLTKMLKLLPLPAANA